MATKRTTKKTAPETAPAVNPVAEAVKDYNTLVVDFSKEIQTETELRKLVNLFNDVARDLNEFQYKTLSGLLGARLADVNEVLKNAAIDERISEKIVKSETEIDYAPMWRALFNGCAYKARKLTFERLSKEAKQEGVNRKIEKIDDANREFTFTEFVERFKETQNRTPWTIPEDGIPFERAVCKLFKSCARWAFLKLSVPEQSEIDGSELTAEKAGDFTLNGKDYEGGTMTANREIGKYILSTLLPKGFVDRATWKARCEARDAGKEIPAGNDGAMCFKRAHLVAIGAAGLTFERDHFTARIDIDQMFNILTQVYDGKDKYEFKA